MLHPADECGREKTDFPRQALATVCHSLTFGAGVYSQMGSMLFLLHALGLDYVHLCVHAC